MIEAIFALIISVAHAEPNADIVGYCKASSPSYAAMATCIETEKKARNLQSCLDALAAWPKDTPCPAEWFQLAIRNIRENQPCQMHEVPIR